MQNFNITLEDQEFRFRTMNILKCRLFHVYTTYEGKECRFHMGRDTDDEAFEIPDIRNCPPPFRDYAPVLSEAIISNWTD